MRRGHERISSDFYVNKVVDGVPYLARTRDLSSTGVYLHRLIEPRVRPDASVALQFVFPGTEEILWADVDVVRYDRDSGFGLKFRSLTPRVNRLLADYLSARRPFGEDSPGRLV